MSYPSVSRGRGKPRIGIKHRPVGVVAEPSHAARRTPSLGEAILWIIEEDAPGDNLSVDDLAASLTVCLVADLFGKQCREIAAAVHGARNGSLWVGDFRVLMAALMKRGDSNEGARAYLQKLGGKS